MFYGCPNLEVVILPESGKCCDRVFVYKDEIEYYTKHYKERKEYYTKYYKDEKEYYTK
jgi:hypothetical protein